MTEAFLTFHFIYMYVYYDFLSLYFIKLNYNLKKYL